MQEYNKVNLTDLVKDAILKLDSTTQSLASSFSGTAFPTNNIAVGMPYFNTNNNCFYMCTAVPDGEQATWTVMGQVGLDPGKDDKGQVISSVYTTKTETTKLEEKMNDLEEKLTALVEEAKKTSYPRVGDIICTKNTTNPSVQYPGTTWSLLGADTFLMSATTAGNVGKTGGANAHTITEAQMPAHSHAAWSAAAGGHNHDRGNMEITGLFGGRDVQASYYTSGAFYVSEYGNWNDEGGYYHYDYPKTTMFQASRTWTGYTSWCNDHAHAIGIGATGSGQAYDSRPKYISVYMWIRTA